MSEIERAIKHFEGLQKRYTTQHNGKHCDLVATALEALREQAERVLCAKCKHYNKTGCSAGFGWCENMDRGTHDEFYCSLAERSEGQ